MVCSLAIGCVLALGRSCPVPVMAHMFLVSLLVSLFVRFLGLGHVLYANAMHLYDNGTACTVASHYHGWL